MEPPTQALSEVSQRSPPVIFNHFNVSVCAPLVILKCLFELAAISVEYTVSFPVTVKSPDTATWSVILQSFDSVNTPLVSAQFHSAASATPTKLANKKRRSIVNRNRRSIPNHVDTIITP